MLEACCRYTLDSEGIAHVLSVGPRLHQPCRDEGQDAHRRPEPGDPDRGIGTDERGNHRTVCTVPPRKQIVATHGATPHEVYLHGIARRCEDLVDGAGEGVRVDHRQPPRIVEVGQVADLVPNGPPLCRGVQVPPGVVVGQTPHHRTQRVVLGVQVHEQVGKRGHGTRLRHPTGTGPLADHRSPASVLHASVSSQDHVIDTTSTSGDAHTNRSTDSSTDST